MLGVPSLRHFIKRNCNRESPPWDVSAQPRIIDFTLQAQFDTEHATQSNGRMKVDSIKVSLTVQGSPPAGGRITQPHPYTLWGHMCHMLYLLSDDIMEIHYNKLFCKQNVANVPSEFLRKFDLLTVQLNVFTSLPEFITKPLQSKRLRMKCILADAKQFL